MIKPLTRSEVLWCKLDIRRGYSRAQIAFWYMGKSSPVKHLHIFQELLVKLLCYQLRKGWIVKAQLAHICCLGCAASSFKQMHGACFAFEHPLHQSCGRKKKTRVQRPLRGRNETVPHACAKREILRWRTCTPASSAIRYRGTHHVLEVVSSTTARHVIRLPQANQLTAGSAAHNNVSSKST